ncbi:hypothetical protein B0H10DRAFT_1740836, partial [Mycena sp. CBHHK59/15]
STDSFPQPRCHPETRLKMLEDLWGWSLDTKPSNSILWLYGPAGAGKSAIAQTLSQRLHETGRLGASFFFRRGHTTRGSAKALFATIAYQVALSFPSLRTPISHRVECDSSIVARSMSAQFKKLILEPCCSLKTSKSLTIIIDGLDECDSEVAQKEVLRTLGNSLQDHKVPLWVLVASRPEPHIRKAFEGPCFHGIYAAFNVQQSFGDVRRYLHDEFDRIYREHSQTMATVPHPWPPVEVLETLVDRSSGHFIYAATIIKFIDDEGFRPTERLAATENLTIMEFDSPFAALDQLYIQILS